MKRTGWLTMLLVAPFLAACAQGGDAGGEKAGQDTAEKAAATDTAAKAGGMKGTSVAMAPKNESGLAGTAVLKPAAGDSLKVELSLSGLTDGKSYPAHVHKGTCQSPGTVVAGLTNVTADGTTGTSTTRIADPRAGDAEGPFLVMAHLPDGTPAVCGDIPTEKEPPTGGSGAKGGSSSGGSR